MWLTWCGFGSYQQESLALYCDSLAIINISNKTSDVIWYTQTTMTFEWRHNVHDSVSNHRCLDCLLNCLFRRRSKKTSKLPITGLYQGNSPVTGEFPAQRASNTENVSSWWRHHGIDMTSTYQSWHRSCLHHSSNFDTRQKTNGAIDDGV